MIKKFSRNHSLIVLYRDDGKILFQDRRDISKDGEEYGFFGGGVEEGETFLEAVIRETKEELNIDIKVADITLACNFSKTIAGLGTSENHIFVSSYKQEYNKDLKILEGRRGVWWNLEEAKKQIFFNHDYMVFALLEIYFSQIYKR